MRVFVTGATGFIGRALVPRLQRDGHTIVAWARSATRARALLGADVEIVTGALGGPPAVRRCDAPKGSSTSLENRSSGSGGLRPGARGSSRAAWG